jgi:hypothetical protein
MRILTLALAALFVCSAPLLHAAMITPEESKVQAEFKKEYNNPDKTARIAALAKLEGAKHSSSWQLVYSVATTDPEEAVRMAAIATLAKEPAHDTSLARMLAQIFSAIKFNDVDKKTEVAKAIAPSEFKYDIVAAIVDHLIKLRYPDVPAPYRGTNGMTNDKAIENAEKARKEFDGLLAAFNEIAKSEVGSATKESPQLLRRWWDASQAKFVAADRELALKYRKEDEAAAKAAAEAAKAAKAAK